MAPQAGGVFNWGGAIWCHVLNKVSKSEGARFFEALHYFAYNHVDVSTVFDEEVVLVHDLFRDH